MQELELTCTCQALRLPSLGLILTRGQVVHVPVGDGGNPEVQQALRNGGMVARPVERFVEQRLPQAPPVRVTRLQPPVVAPVVAEVLKADLAPFAGASMTVEVRQEMLGLMKEALASFVVPGGGAQGVSESRTTAPALVAPDPVFIPSGLVDATAKVDITAQTEASDAGGLDEASQALRNVRKSRRR